MMPPGSVVPLALILVPSASAGAVRCSPRAGVAFGASVRVPPRVIVEKKP
jgi:hypothetical protein